MHFDIVNSIYYRHILQNFTFIIKGNVCTNKCMINTKFIDIFVI